MGKVGLKWLYGDGQAGPFMGRCMGGAWGGLYGGVVYLVPVYFKLDFSLILLY